VAERPGVTREGLQSLTGFSTAVVAQNLRRMVSRGELREQQLPDGQTGYTTSAIDPRRSRCIHGQLHREHRPPVTTASNATVESP